MPPLCTVCGTVLPAKTGAQCPRCLFGLGETSAALSGNEDILVASGMRKFGDYELVEEIARGGMGVVYRARQLSLQRDVALKMILSGELAGSTARRMFQTEALAAAALHHPNIVAVYDTGEQDLQPYIAMRFVPGGRTIAHWAAAARERGDWRALAKAVASVARAVAHAHERGVLHRDLKPSNILWDNEAGPQVTDFGLAKLLSEGGEGHTISLHMLGSPGYMAPEQAAARHDEVTTSTDVYGLGAVLYEVLSGRPPYSGRSALETARRVMEEAPVPLKNVPRDLATVCQKCMARLPADRYSQAIVVAQELERFVRGEPVLAVRLPALPRLWRWSRRRPAVASLLALLATALVGGVSGIVWQWRKAEGARELQAVALQSAENANAAQSEAIRHLRWREMDSYLEKGEAARALARAAAFLREHPDDRGAAMMGMSIVDRNAFPLLAAPEVAALPARGVAARMSPDGRWIVHASVDQLVHVFDARTGKEAASFTQLPTTPPEEGNPAKPRDVVSIEVGTGANPLAVASADGQLTLRPLPLGVPAVVLRQSKPASEFWEIAFSKDGSTVMARSNASILIWKLNGTGVSDPLEIPFLGGFKGAALSGNGGVVAGWNDARAAVWNAETGKDIMMLATGGPPSQVSLSEDGRYAVLADGKEHIQVWDLNTRTALPGSARYTGEFAKINGDGSRVIAGGNGCNISIHDTASSLPVAEKLWPHRVMSYFNSRFPLPSPWLSVSLDGRTFAATGLDNTVNLWNAETGRALCSPLRLGQGPDYATVHLAPDADKWLTHSRVFKSGASVEARLAVWKRTLRAEPVRTRIDGMVFSAAVVSPDGRFGAVAYSSNSARRESGVTVTDFASSKVVLQDSSWDFARILMFSPDSQKLFGLSSGSAFLTSWDLATGKKTWSAAVAEGAAHVAAVSPDGRAIAVASHIPGRKDAEVALVDTLDGSVRHRQQYDRIISVLRFAGDGSGKLFVGGSGSLGEVWDSMSGNIAVKFPEDANVAYNTAAWSPDSRQLAVASESTVRIRDIHRGGETVLAFTAGAWISHIVFSPDGKRIAVTSRDGTHCVWDAATGQPLWPARWQGDSGESIHFLPDGATFVVQDSGGFRYWSTDRGEPVTAYYPAPWAGTGTVDCAAYRAVLTPDGGKIFTGHLASETALWTIPLPRGVAPSWLPELFEALALMKENADGTTSFVHGRAIGGVRESIARAAKDDPFAVWARRVLGEGF